MKEEDNPFRKFFGERAKTHGVTLSAAEVEFILEVAGEALQAADAQTEEWIARFEDYQRHVNREAARKAGD